MSRPTSNRDVRARGDARRRARWGLAARRSSACAEWRRTVPTRGSTSATATCDASHPHPGAPRRQPLSGVTARLAAGLGVDARIFADERRSCPHNDPDPRRAADVSGILRAREGTHHVVAWTTRVQPRHGPRRAFWMRSGPPTLVVVCPSNRRDVRGPRSSPCRDRRRPGRAPHPWSRDPIVGGAR